MIPALAASKFRTYERQSHQAVARVQVMPVEEPGTWVDLPVSEAKVTINEVGVQPLQTLEFTTTERAARECGLSVLGSWVRVWQDLTFWTPTELVARCDWGYYRVEAMTIWEERGEVGVDAADAGIVLDSAPALTLAQKSIPKGTSLVTRLSQLLESAWPAGVYRWAPLLDTNGVVDRPMAAVGMVYDESRVEVVTILARLLGAILVPVRDGTAIYRLVPRPDGTARSGVTINPGDGGNLVDRQVTFDRSSLVNQAHVVWEEDKPPSAGGGVGIRQQVRVVVSYDDDGSPIATDTQFGIQSVEVSSNDITSLAEATAAAKGAIRGSMAWNHDYPMDVSPIYGIESGDIVYVQRVSGFQVVGGSIDLMGTWSLVLRRSDGTLLTGSPHYSISNLRWEGTISDDARWIEINVPKTTLDTTFEKATGWSITGGTMSAKDGVLTIKATSTTVLLKSGAVVPVPALRRVGVAFSMGRSTLNNKRRGYQASAAIRYDGKVYTDGQFPDNDDPIEGPVKATGRDVTVSADQQLPAGTPDKFAVSIKFYGLAVGQVIKVENATIERAMRPKES